VTDPNDPPFVAGSDTSYAAARSVRHTAPAQREQVFATLYARGPSTAEELEVVLGLAGNSIRPRLVELRRDGRVVDTGRRRRTQSRRYAVVWAVAEIEL
jgi:transcription initiation factor IIE alpha subunit